MGSSDQPSVDPAQTRAVLELMGWPDDRDQPDGGEVPPGILWELAEDLVRAATNVEQRTQLTGWEREIFERAARRLRAEIAVAQAARDWVEARGGWMTDDPDRRATPADLALIEAVDALAALDQPGVIGDA